MNSPNLNRREFLAITAVVLEAAFVGWPMTAKAHTTDEPVDLSLLSEKVGEQYLSLFPAEKNLVQLKQTLHFDTHLSEVEIKAKLRNDIHGDFAAAQTFRYAGWVFSRTEGRLCAYKALIG